jgi:hypothetical protein
MTTMVFTEEQLNDLALTKAHFSAVAVRAMNAKRKQTPAIPLEILLDCWVSGALAGAAGVLYQTLPEEARDGVEELIKALVNDAIHGACVVARGAIEQGEATGGRDDDDSVH